MTQLFASMYYAGLVSAVRLGTLYSYPTYRAAR